MNPLNVLARLVKPDPKCECGYFPKGSLISYLPGHLHHRYWCPMFEETPKTARVAKRALTKFYGRPYSILKAESDAKRAAGK